MGPWTVGEGRGAAGACQALLGEAADRDWARPIPEMDWTVTQAVTPHGRGHPLVRHRPGRRASERQDTMELRVPPEASNAELVRVIGTFATVLARVVDASPPGTRGWHPFGLADAPGFAAMACDESSSIATTPPAASASPSPHRARLVRRDPGAPVPLGSRRHRPVAGPALVQRPRRPPRPPPPGPLALALRPPRRVGRPQPGRPPLTRSRHSSRDPTAAGPGGGG